jgi:hypothetical protein
MAGVCICDSLVVLVDGDVVSPSRDVACVGDGGNVCQVETEDGHWTGGSQASVRSLAAFRRHRVSAASRAMTLRQPGGAVAPGLTMAIAGMSPYAGFPCSSTSGLTFNFPSFDSRLRSLIISFRHPYNAKPHDLSNAASIRLPELQPPNAPPAEARASKAVTITRHSPFPSAAAAHPRLQNPRRPSLQTDMVRRLPPRLPVALSATAQPLAG